MDDNGSHWIDEQGECRMCPLIFFTCGLMSSLSYYISKICQHQVTIQQSIKLPAEMYLKTFRHINQFLSWHGNARKDDKDTFCGWCPWQSCLKLFENSQNFLWPLLITKKCSTWNSVRSWQRDQWNDILNMFINFQHSEDGIHQCIKYGEAK